MSKQSKTNWDRVDNLRDEDIDYWDNPRLEAGFFENKENPGKMLRRDKRQD